jgi:EAL domain-containing protein (putative c-di-GMP-specific phosphodiesterase class I)
VDAVAAADDRLDRALDQARRVRLAVGVGLLGALALSAPAPLEPRHVGERVTGAGGGPGVRRPAVACLEASGTEPGALTLEITESLFMRNFPSAVEKLRQLRELGVKVAIDDFGTGWSSFSRLRSMPIDILKIDKAFVDGVTRGPEESAVAQAIVRMASSFGLQAVAEGIEFPGQAEALTEMKCDMGQGYYFSPPLAADALVASMRRRWLPTPG